LQPGDPLPVLAAVRKHLRRRWDLVFARQLFHNRNEVTFVLRAKPA
jgi:hypothetical protein